MNETAINYEDGGRRVQGKYKGNAEWLNGDVGPRYSVAEGRQIRNKKHQIRNEHVVMNTNTNENNFIQHVSYIRPLKNKLFTDEITKAKRANL